MVLIYHLLTSLQYVSYSNIISWPTSNTNVFYYYLLTPHTIPMVLNYHLLNPYLYLCTQLPSTDPIAILMTLNITYWPLDYTYGTLLSSTVPCLYLWYSATIYWLHVYAYSTQLLSTDSLAIPMVLCYHLMTPLQYLWYTTLIFYPHSRTFRPLLSSTDTLAIHMVLFYHLLFP